MQTLKTSMLSVLFLLALGGPIHKGPDLLFFKHYQTVWFGAENFSIVELVEGIEQILEKKFEIEGELAELIVKTGLRYRLDPIWLTAVIWTESSFNPKAKSHLGARGYMQLMPGTAREVLESLPGEKLPHWLTPEGNLYLGSFYLKELLIRFRGNHKLATMAYNLGTAGLLRRMRASGVPTMKYWKKIQKRYNTLSYQIKKTGQLVKADSVIHL